LSVSKEEVVNKKPQHGKKKKFRLQRWERGTNLRGEVLVTRGEESVGWKKKKREKGKIDHFSKDRERQPPTVC